MRWIELVPEGKAVSTVRTWLTGRCFDFALALAERMPDAEFVAVGGSPSYPEHVGLRRNGRYYDVRGITDQVGFRAHHVGPIVVVSRDVVELHAGVAGMTPPYKGNRDIAEARRAVRAIYGRTVKEAAGSGVDGPRRIQDLSDYFREMNAQEDLEAGDEPFDPNAPNEAHHRYVGENYLFGECAAFAVALHRMTGWPIFQIKSYPSYHVFLQDPKRRLVDASGYTTLAKIRRVHRIPFGTTPQPVQASDLIDDLNDDSLSDPWHQVRMAEFYIRQLRMPPFDRLTEAVDTGGAAQTIPILYHGTCEDSAVALLQHGWQPHRWTAGGNKGQSRYLYLSTGYEDALWFAQEKGCDVVIEVHDVPLDYLIPDPEDGTGETVAEELASSQRLGMPAKLALRHALPASHFRRR